ncbi:MAG: dihydropteroate synthase [Phycisphaerae bacterium]|nr:dihydropteroate synthase [Phycisphaerae bacterium]
MGILNVTPDSFSDGGKFFDTNAAVEHGLQMAAEGAAILDIGPESSRPGSQRVSAADQIRRAIPVIERLIAKINIPISIDTCLPEVASAALDTGAAIINDITALSDPRMASLAAERGAAVVLMHILGTPETMQVDPRYENVTAEVLDFLIARAAIAERAGIRRDRIFIDPGIGFGKTTEHNLQLLKNLNQFVATGYRVLVGTSRKRFLGQITGRTNPADRIFGTAATVAHCVAAGTSVVRVHDVAAMIDVIRIIRAISL